MDAVELTKALGGQWHGSYGQARCPAHDDRDPSLTIRVGDRGTLVWCQAGCDQNDVIDCLRSRHLWSATDSDHAPPPRRARPPVRRDDEHQRRQWAFDIWQKTSHASGTLAEQYLRSRGITIALPKSLRYGSAVKYSPSGIHMSALLAAIQRPDDRLTAIQRIYLTHDGRKAPVAQPKMTLGPVVAGAARLGPAGQSVGIAEGIETALSAQQLFDISVWARCGSSLDGMWLPDHVREVQIFADNGDAGRAAADRARDHFTAQGKRVFIRIPPEHFPDWNDALQADHEAG